jgi:thioredoxin-related protein
MTRRFLMACLATLALAFPALAAEEDGVIVGDDGLFKQAWFTDTFLEMGDDLKEAASQGKNLLIIVEQKGCPYCRELHRVNFQDEDLVTYLNQNYMVVQLDLYGSRGTVDFDGEALEERDLVAKWGVQFTPTTILIDAANVGASNIRDAESFRLPGYLKVFHYLSSLEYVKTGAYHELGFQRFIQEKADKMREEGKEVDIW